MSIPVKSLLSRYKGTGGQFTDEPTGNLDSRNCWAIVGLFRRLATEHSQTIIMISHNNGLIQATDRIITLYDGTIR